jgi:tetratricopeptide (TPR) repeat protein
MMRFVFAVLLAFSTTSGGAAADTQLAEHLDAAQRAERAQNYLAASKEYEAILSVHPEQALVRQSLAVTYHLQDRYPEAITEFQRALKQDPKLWGAWLFLGMDYYKTNRFPQAISPLEKSIALNDKMAEPEARYWLGSTYSALGRPEDAVKEFRRDLELRPKNADVLYILTRTYDQAAGAVFERLGRIEPNPAAVFLLQAERFLDENKLDLAKVEYRKALQIRPDFAGRISALAADVPNAADRNLPVSTSDAKAKRELAALSTAHPSGSAALAAARQGISFMEQGHFEDARPLLEKAIASANANAYLKLSLIRCYSETGDYLTAEDHLRKFLSVDPQNADALDLLGRNYKHLASATLEQLMAVDPDSYGVHELLGQRHEEKTEFDLAIQEYKKALAKRPDSGGIRYAIGNVYLKTSQYDQAERWLSEEVKRNPYHGLAQYRLGSVLVEEGKAAEAIPHLQQALLSHPQLTDARLELGRAYTAAGRYDESIAELKQVVQSEPDNDRVHYLLSAAYAKQGKRQQAQEELMAYQRLTRMRLERTQHDINAVSNSAQPQ